MSYFNFSIFEGLCFKRISEMISLRSKLFFKSQIFPLYSNLQSRYNPQLMGRLIPALISTKLYKVIQRSFLSFRRTLASPLWDVSGSKVILNGRLEKKLKISSFSK